MQFPCVFLEPAPEDEAKSGPGLVIYQDPEVKHYQALIESSRVRLADLEAEFGVEKAKVDSIRAMLFEALRSLYEERDSLIRLIQYRTIYIDRLLLEGEESAEEAAGEYEEASRKQEKQYSSTASELEGKKELNEEEKSKLKTLWHKLVKLFHPDLHENDPAKRKTFELLTGMINDAKERGDIDLLETIAKDPEAFILEQGWDYVSLGDPGGIEKVRSLYDHLQTRVLTLIEAIDTLKEGPDYELFLFEKEKKGVIIEVIAGQKSDLEKELKALRAEAEHVRIDARATLPEPAPSVAIVERVRSSKPASGTWRTIALPGLDGSDTEAAWTTALAAHLGGEAEQAIDGVVAGRVDVLTEAQAIELDGGSIRK